MRALSDTKEFRELAARVIWFEPPDVALGDVPRFMAYAFRYATYEDIKVLRGVMSDDDLLLALANAPPGIIDARSWCYWHVVLGVFPAPAMPRWGLASQENELNVLAL